MLKRIHPFQLPFLWSYCHTVGARCFVPEWRNPRMTGHKALCPYLAFAVCPTLQCFRSRWFGTTGFAIANGGSVRRDPPYGFFPGFHCFFFLVFSLFLVLFLAVSLFVSCFVFLYAFLFLWNVLGAQLGYVTFLVAGICAAFWYSRALALLPLWSELTIAEEPCYCKAITTGTSCNALAVVRLHPHSLPFAGWRFDPPCPPY